MNSTLRIVKYIKNQLGLGLLFPSQGDTKVIGYCDSDWASCLEIRRSISGYCIRLGGSLISWKVKKLITTSKSSIEAEYKSIGSAVSEIIWIKGLLEVLNVQNEVLSFCAVTTRQHCRFHRIQCTTRELNTLKSIVTL